MSKAELVKTYMEKYSISKEEALEMIAYDEETDKMTVSEINKSMTPEQRKAVKDATKTTSAEKPAKKAPVRVKDAEKVELIEKINEFLVNLTDSCEIANAGQEIAFKIGENAYSLKLSKHRAPKK